MYQTAHMQYRHRHNSVTSDHVLGDAPAVVADELGRLRRAEHKDAKCVSVAAHTIASVRVDAREAGRGHHVAAGECT